jgi:DNA-binding NarL/FixJ family response regulator
MQGRAAQAVGHFDLLLDISTRCDRIHTRVNRLSTAATNAVTLGLVERASLFHDSALNLANQHALGYDVPLSALTYAWTCLSLGELARARLLLETAESWPTNHFYVRLLRSAVGVLLAILTRDDEGVDRFLDVGALEIAFKSEAPQRIGPIAAAVYEYHRSRGRLGAASELLSRSLRAICNPDDCWWLLLKAAESGTAADVGRAMAILKHYDDEFALARAHRLLLKARSAHINDQPSRAADLASEAAEVLSALGWRCHQAAALELAERFIEARHLYKTMGVSAHPARIKIRGRTKGVGLTTRQLEIVRLAVSGLTNRSIAERLGTAERTVKYHLTAAFNALGCESRHQLASFIGR